MSCGRPWPWSAGPGPTPSGLRCRAWPGWTGCGSGWPKPVCVRLEPTGEPRSLPVAVDVTGYRIVQESLTNVLRHSGAGQATVGIGYEAGSVRIVVSNPVTEISSGVGGFGISGMRERVLALGGEFSAGPASHDRFEVRARLPAGGHS
jgi:signal transduction histidine kinase